MESIKISALNQVLSMDTRKKYFLSERKGHHGVTDGGYGSQEDYNETFKYYRHPDFPENIFLEITERTDSYGDNDKIHEMKIVTGVAKQVTVYEPVK